VKSAVKIGSVTDVEPGQGRAFDVGDKRVAVFNVNGGFFAIDDTCPHAGASLSEGEVEDGKICCPWHYAEFDLETGNHLNAPATCDVAAYKVVVEGEDLLVEV
jgi:nitrite reductase/ring-hydroxylating ferredoxin subunit